MFFSWGLPLKGKKILGFFIQRYAKKCIFEIQDYKPLGPGWDFSQDYIGIGYCGMEGNCSFIYDLEILNHSPGPVLFLYRENWVLHGELVGTNSPQARNLFNRGCSTSRASLLRGIISSLEMKWDLGSAWWSHPGVPWSHNWGLILSSHSFWSFLLERM